MKLIAVPTLLALAASACCAQSSAQSSVTIYGILDAGITHVSGLKGGSIKQLSSGIMDGSRLGFRGNEDLGGGYRALFTLESRLEVDTGTVSNRPPSGSQLPDRVSQAALLGLPGARHVAVNLPQWARTTSMAAFTKVLIFLELRQRSGNKAAQMGHLIHWTYHFKESCHDR